MILCCRGLLFEPGEPFSGTCHSRLELAFFKQAVFVSINQPTDPTLHRLDLFVDLRHVDVRFLVAIDTALELLAQRLRVLQQLTHVGPDGCIESVETNGPMRADLGSATAK